MLRYKSNTGYFGSHERIATVGNRIYRSPCKTKNRDIYLYTSNTVSYTHLDVYKRQDIYIEQPKPTTNNSNTGEQVENVVKTLN